MTGSRSLGGSPEGGPMHPLEVSNLFIHGNHLSLPRWHDSWLVLDTQRGANHRAKRVMSGT